MKLNAKYIAWLTNVLSIMNKYSTILLETILYAFFTSQRESKVPLTMKFTTNQGNKKNPDNTETIDPKIGTMWRIINTNMLGIKNNAMKNPCLKLDQNFPNEGSSCIFPLTNSWITFFEYPTNANHPNIGTKIHNAIHILLGFPQG